MIRLAIHGALGRMGQTVAHLAVSSQDFLLTAALEREDHPELGQNYYSLIGMKLPQELPIEKTSLAALEKADGVIDFSSPQGALQLAQLCAHLGLPLVSGTTGFREEEYQEFLKVSEKIPLLYSTNMSLGVNLLFALTKMAARLLKDKNFDAELMEIHHGKKKDAPSGTAKTLEAILRQEMSLPSHLVVYGRQGLVGERRREELGVLSIRGGDVVGEHTVYFLGHGERLELKHLATSREIFARGALMAIKYLRGKNPGLYTMQHVLGIE
ncbi:MAG: 4-hydroxy-tetrahydrodipicolinate reductase [Leptospiraceae bacterium]|nr:4-hydroxy-tetrahydrodipicolinate reductase [Leptospiraceae bacterium]MDW8305605.1 4-hydroxy-tetrahydrodipicolinate reductase [Leptospiraceae bacterium]